MQTYVNTGCALLVIIITQDEATVDGNGRRSLIPVYATTANVRAAGLTFTSTCDMSRRRRNLSASHMHCMNTGQCKRITLVSADLCGWPSSVMTLHLPVFQMTLVSVLVLCAGMFVGQN